MKKGRLTAAIICMGVAFAGLFLPVAWYGSSPSIMKFIIVIGNREWYYIFDMISGRFFDEVLYYYRGPVSWHMTEATIIIFVIIYIIALGLAIMGVMIMRKQVPSKLIFILMLIGMVGMVFPSVVLLVGTLMPADYFDNTLIPGGACFIPIIAMIICILLVTKEYRAQRAMQKHLIGAGLLRRGGDL